MFQGCYDVRSSCFHWLIRMEEDAARDSIKKLGKIWSWIFFWVHSLLRTITYSCLGQCVSLIYDNCHWRAFALCKAYVILQIEMCS